MKNIEIEDDLYKYILANIESFGETPSQILRRLLSIPKDISKANNTSELKPVKKEKSLPVNKKNYSASSKVVNEIQTIINNTLIAEAPSLAVSHLFDDMKFKKEPIVTNKFLMMLTTMYHENTNAFVLAAKKTRGRTRDYLGQHLNELLSSNNEEELTLFKASKPRAIPDTPFWVITNANTGRKRIILTQMMASMGYPHHLIERIKEEI
jgi:negative modulator of initiation of replication